MDLKITRKHTNPSVFNVPEFHHQTEAWLVIKETKRVAVVAVIEESTCWISSIDYRLSLISIWFLINSTIVMLLESMIIDMKLFNLLITEDDLVYCY